MSAAVATGPARVKFETDIEPKSLEHPTPSCALTVIREDINFSTIRPGVLGVEIAVRNKGPRRSEPTFGILRSAPLGAFVPWRPLAVLQIPAIAAGGSVVIRHKVRYRAPAVLGSADKIPPNRLLTALGLDEPEPSRRKDRLPDDPMALIGRGSAYWAGNLNLFFPAADVERHTAQALRIYPGTVNMAIFIVGMSNGRDAYRFRLSGDGTGWGPRLVDAMRGRTIAASAVEGRTLADGEWHVPSSSIVLLTVEPPHDAQTGVVNVHVEQRSTRREAVVEFTLDANAAGPGCYVV